MFLNAILLALREIRRNVLRSSLTILGIVIGVAAVITMVTIGEGATAQVQADMEACLAAGGSVTGEHGIGSDKLAYMPLAFSAASLSMMCDVRRAFDPDGRANPGKVLPTHSCREWHRGSVT